MHILKLVGIVVGLSGFCLADGSEDSHAAHPSHHHHMAVFGGATIHDSHAYPSAGLDYEFLFHPAGGVVGLAELVFADHTAQIYGLGLAFHPVPPLKAAVIPALETAEGHSAFLLRGSLEYGFHLGPLTLAPSVNVDYVSSEVLYVAGVAVGTGF